MSGKKKNNVPRLRFPGFDEDWGDFEMGEIFKRIVVGFVGTVSKYYCEKENGVLFIRTLNVREGWFSLNEVQYVTSDFHKKNKKSQIKNGDVLIARVGANMGMVCMVKGLSEEANSANVIIIKNQENVSSKFYSLYLNSESGQRQISARGAGGAQDVLNISVAKTIKVPFPSLPEQKKIASFLTAVDTKLRQLKRKKELLEEYKKGVMQQLFSREIRFKDEDGKDFPAWEEKRLGEVCQSVKRKSKNLYVPVLTISTGNGFVNQKERFNKVIAGSSLKNYTLIKKNEFSYNRGSSKMYPFGCIYRLKKHVEALVPFVYRSFKFIYGNPEFFEHLFAFNYLDRQLKKIITSSARMDGLLNISESNFYDVKILFPSQKEQQKIATFLTALDGKINQLTEQVEKMESWKKGLLQGLVV